ncbi:hypothetical protein R6Q59_029322 [Mikania micrantha]|uniref:RING-type E3 ubiquitin transferase n=1 Tax=Mikania micrantha TaxID=192012 RepID=A0A5N6LVK8_9ASTR|nr:hypothetical protein E3N88_39005 [Mikania micrantha]
MPCRFRLLVGQTSLTTVAPKPPPEPQNMGSDFVIILAAFLSTFICILGLVALVQCTWIRRISGIALTGGSNQSLTAAANKGLKKKILNTLPKIIYSPETMAETVGDCAICLTEFTAGDEIRVLPRCGHGFHATCIDKWFGYHSSCPYCRQILAPPPKPGSKSCGESQSHDAEPLGSLTITAGEINGSINRFLP